MRKIICFVLLALLMANLCSCVAFFGNSEPPKTATINGEKWCLAYENGSLYPLSNVIDGDKATVDGDSFYYSEGGEYEYMVCYSYKGKPSVYFKEEELESARAYYDNAENYSYYCITGNIHDANDHHTYEVPDMDPEMLSKLLAFALERSYDPFVGRKGLEGERTIPFDPEGPYTDGEIVFCKESKDGGALSTDKGTQFRIEDGKLVLFCFYDFDGYNDYADPRMYVIDVPEDLGDYFVRIVNALEQ